MELHPLPCDRYDPDHVCNASDNAGRYTYSKQPEVCKWNLQKLAEALEPELPLALGETIVAEEFDTEFQKHYLQKMRRKLGLVQGEREEDGALVAKLLETMHLTGERGMHALTLHSLWKHTVYSVDLLWQYSGFFFFFSQDGVWLYSLVFTTIIQVGIKLRGDPPASASCVMEI